MLDSLLFGESNFGAAVPGQLTKLALARKPNAARRPSHSVRPWWPLLADAPLRADLGAVQRCFSPPCLPVGEPVLTHSPYIKTVEGMPPLLASRTCAIAASLKVAVAYSRLWKNRLL